jgi:hypothetical protein
LITALVVVLAGAASCSSTVYRDINYGTEVGAGFEAPQREAGSDAPDAATGGSGGTGTGGSGGTGTGGTGTGGTGGAGTGGSPGTGGAGGSDGSAGADTAGDGNDAATLPDSG